MFNITINPNPAGRQIVRTQLDYYLSRGFRIQSIAKGRITLHRHIHRRGSVLVLVVVLLVLLALMGTAYITTTRTDRYASEQHKTNTQIDLLMDGVKQITFSRLANMPAEYRNGLYLSARHPQAMGTAPTDPIAWPSIGIPLDLTTYAGTRFSDPTTGTLVNALPGANKDTFYFQPWSVSGHPGFNLVNATGAEVDFTGATGGTARFVAADADGDGIADAGYFKIPGGTIDGVTYYAALRIIDNNSAINVNTAWSQTDFTATGAATAIANQGLFLTSTGMTELFLGYNAAGTPLIDQGSEAQSLHIARTGRTAWGTDGSDLQAGITGNVAGTNPFPDTGTTARSDFAFASQGDAMNSQLALRVDNPGRNGSATVSYKAYPLTDSYILSYPFAIRPPTSSVSMTSLESALSLTLNPMKTAPYDPLVAGATYTWFTDNFVWGDRTGDPTRPGDATHGSLRSYFVTRNPVSNAAPIPKIPSGVTLPVTTGAPAYWTAHPTKADANTSDFSALWRAYWSAMADPENADQPLNPADPNCVFRSSARGFQFVANTAKNTEMLMLRSAIAAANTIALREWQDLDTTSIPGRSVSRDFIPSFYVPLRAPTDPAPVNATIFGLKRQPLISQVIYERQVDNTGTPINLDYTVPAPGSTPGYIAFEIYNPNPTVTIDLTNYRLVTYNRGAGVGNPLTYTSILPFPAPTPPTTIAPMPAVASDRTLPSPPNPPQPRIIVEEGTRPTTMNVPAGVVVYNMPGLLNVVGKEAMLVRTRSAAGPGSGTMPPNATAYDERLVADGGVDANIVNWVPLDQIDLRGLDPTILPPLAPFRFPLALDPAQTPFPNRDRRTYIRPNYDGITPGAATVPPMLGGNPWECVYSGVYTAGTGHDFQVSANGMTNVTLPDPADPTTFIYAADSTTNALGFSSTTHVPALAGGAPNYAIEVNAFGSAGPRPWQSTITPTKQFPFGAFARNGDILQVPFVGSYKIESGSPTVINEINSVTLDVVEATDVTAVGANQQQIGRFWPIALPATYDFAKKLFDYVTVQSPQADYLPNVANGTGIPYDGSAAYAPAPDAVPNGPVIRVADANQGNEWSVGVNGLINVNTASWKVLSMLPLVVDATGKVDNDVATGYRNDTMAKAIVTEREAAAGPFTSIFDFYNRVPGIKSPTGYAYDAAHGELMPVSGGDTAFRTQTLQLIRLSNLITTRSDTFTVYLLVQGWRTGAARPEVERREAFNFNRTTNTVTPIPTR